MKGNFHVQFLGEGVAATSPPYPTPGWATTQVYPARISPAPDFPQQLSGRTVLKSSVSWSEPARWKRGRN